LQNAATILDSLNQFFVGIFDHRSSGDFELLGNDARHHYAISGLVLPIENIERPGAMLLPVGITILKEFAGKFIPRSSGPAGAESVAGFKFHQLFSLVGGNRTDRDCVTHVLDQPCGTVVLDAPDTIRWHTLKQLGTLKINDG
jgi:hypothetical protein